MKKGIISTLAILILVAGTASAQVFMIDEETPNQRGGGEESTDMPFIPTMGANCDQGYVPTGSGALLLAGFAGVYLIGKKKKK